MVTQTLLMQAQLENIETLTPQLGNEFSLYLKLLCDGCDNLSGNVCISSTTVTYFKRKKYNFQKKCEECGRSGTAKILTDTGCLIIANELDTNKTVSILSCSFDGLYPKDNEPVILEAIWKLGTSSGTDDFATLCSGEYFSKEVDGITVSIANFNCSFGNVYQGVSTSNSVEEETGSWKPEIGEVADSMAHFQPFHDGTSRKSRKSRNKKN